LNVRLKEDPMFIARCNYPGTYISSMILPSGGDDKAGFQVDKLGNFYLAADWWKSRRNIWP
jgi:hypothetical protein